MTNTETNDEILAVENNKETDIETIIEKSFDAEMDTESNSSNSKDVQDEANLLQRSSRIREEPN